MKRFRIYCKETTLHGFSYLVEENTRIEEKIFWLLSLIVAFMLTWFYMEELFDSIQKNPIVIYQSDSGILASEIPFPAFTYCSNIKPLDEVINSTRLNSILKSSNKNLRNLNNLTESE